MSLILRPYQVDLYEKTKSLLRHGRKRILIQSPTGSGKCLAPGTPVMLYNGCIVPVEEVRVGDRLMGPDSQPRTVLALGHGKSDMYRVTPVKGDPYVVNENHILSFRMTPSNKMGFEDGEIVNIEVSKYVKRSKTFKHCAKGWRAPVDFPSQYEPCLIHPYMMGVWLGDGDSADFSITTADHEIREAVFEYAASLEMAVRVENNTNASDVLHIVQRKVTPIGSSQRRFFRRLVDGYRQSPLQNALKHYRVVDNKHIPHRYKTGSRDERLNLLAGIIDTDGYRGPNGGFDLTLKSETLLDDVIFVARSLGFSAYKSRSVKTCTNNGVSGEYWRCNINGPVEAIPCKIQRKKAAPRRQVKDPLVTGITVEACGEGEYYGFEIDGDGLFLLGDFTVTHNTALVGHMLGNTTRKGYRAWFINHRREIIKQSVITLTQAAGLNVGIVAAGFPGNRHESIQVCSIQTLLRRKHLFPTPDLIIWDEAHHLAAGSWAAIHADFPHAVHIGLTATPERLDGAGLGSWFDDLITGPSVAKLIEDGWLAPYRYFGPEGADLSAVHTVAGDYNKRELADVMQGSTVVGDALAHYQKYAMGRRAVVFMWSIESSQKIADRFNAAGIPAAHLDGDTDDFARDTIIENFRQGRIKILSNVEIVSEGFDLPAMEAAFLLRPTRSLSLYLQQIGRCLRPAPGKTEALIFDHAGHLKSFGLPDDEHQWSLEGHTKHSTKSRGAPVRQCPRCYVWLNAAVAKCKWCGFAFEIQAREIDQIDGELKELNIEEQRRIRKREQADAQSLEDLIRVGYARGYRAPERWAEHVWKARLAKQASDEARRIFA